ncbi:hypothetical protein [Halostella pelagica]|uniref:hypothetical protein n=1 Tax=Halostella pelagica TaxID=2583824 RepID=UPI0010802A06|nr:hypothetical protein [Halostella pelagica]
MASRYDAVLVAIPLVASSGIVLEAGARALGTSGGGSFLWVVGFVGALCLIAHEILTLPVDGEANS